MNNDKSCPYCVRNSLLEDQKTFDRIKNEIAN